MSDVNSFALEIKDSRHPQSVAKKPAAPHHNGGSPQDRLVRRDFVHGVIGCIHDLEHRLGAIERGEIEVAPDQARAEVSVQSDI
jgi:hypothetical protein